MTLTSGTFSSPNSVSAAYSPQPNAVFSITLSGSFTSAIFYLTASTDGGSTYGLMFDGAGQPLDLYQPGITQVADVGGASYKLVCKTLAGTASYSFNP